MTDWTGGFLEGFAMDSGCISLIPITIQPCWNLVIGETSLHYLDLYDRAAPQPLISSFSFQAMSGYLGLQRLSLPIRRENY